MWLHEMRQQSTKARALDQQSASSTCEIRRSITMVHADKADMHRQRIVSPQRSAPRIAEKHGKVAERRSACRWLLNETNSAAVSVAPLQRKEIGDFFNLGKRTEPEQGG